MKQELLNKINVVKTQITEEEASYSKIPDFLEDIVKSKKRAVVDALKKYQVKMEAELSKIEAQEEKEKREAPIKALMAKINDTMKTLKEQKSALDHAKSMARNNPKDDNALVDSFTLANKVGDTSRALAQLQNEKADLSLSQGK